MKVVVFGATGMVGRAALDACLEDAGIEAVLAVGRTPLGVTHGKLRELVRTDLFDYAGVDLAGYDACFFCLGVSAAGMKEADYRRITYDLTLAAANALVEQSPSVVFIYVSGQGTGGKGMWSRIKAETENALLALPFRAAYMFRPGFIKPKKGVVSKTPLYRVLYAITTPLFPLFKALAPGSVTTSENIGRAMIAVARNGAPSPIVESAEIDRIGA